MEGAFPRPLSGRGTRHDRRDVRAAFYAADDPLVGALPITAGLPETVDALAANLEAELGGVWRREAIAAGASRRASCPTCRPFSTAIGQCSKRCGERYRLGVVSNFYGNLEAVCESSGLAPLFGGDDGQPPGRRREARSGDLPRRSRRASTPRPETTLFVGDSLRRDCEGARRAGMGFIWIAPADVQAAAARTNAPRSILAAVTRLPDLIKVLK